jgi:hypothetical protein
MLPDAEGIAIGMRMLRRSGVVHALIGLTAVVPKNKKLKHLYRFLWQWISPDGRNPIAYEQLEIQV